MKALLLFSVALYMFGSNKRPLFWGAMLFGTAYLAWRGISLGRLPLVGPHDTLIFFTISIAVMALPFFRNNLLRQSSIFFWSVGYTAAIFTLLALAFRPSYMPLPPVLRTFWFEIHVAFAFFSYALFAIGAILGGIYLACRERYMLELQYKAALVGYTFFSASMVSGGIWGYYAWGTYWLWTPKELWTSILWMFYTVYLHLRLKGLEWEKTLAWGGIIGFAVTLFTYLGVSMLMKSSHSF